MDSTPPTALPNPDKSRRGWLILFGLIEILLGCLVVMILASPRDGIPRGAHIVIACFGYVLLPSVFIAGGIGSMLCRNWARKLVLVVSGVCLVYGIPFNVLVGFAVSELFRQRSASLTRRALVEIVGGWGLILLLAPAALLFFYSRESVKNTCLVRKGAKLAAPARNGAAPRAPLVISSVWQTFLALTVLVCVSAGLPIPLVFEWASVVPISVFACLLGPVAVPFGIVLHGVPATLVLLAYALLTGCGAWLTWRQKTLGWKISISNNLLWTLSMLVTYFRRAEILDVFRELGYDGRPLRTYEQIPRLMPFAWLCTLVLMSLFIVFLVYSRQFFPPGDRT